MNFDCWKRVLKKEPKYRWQQLWHVVFKDLIEDWREATIFPKELINTLKEECPLAIDAELFVSKDQKSAKVLITLADELKIESVLMRHGDGRNTVCVSSQVGCPMGCIFCATGKLVFKRNLTTEEIVEQVLFFERYLKKDQARVSNVVFMGMGEPFLNYDNVMSAIKILNDKDGLNLGARKISISTVGVIEGIKKFTKEKLQLNLAISLHAPNNDLRSKIIPANKKHSLKRILAAVDDYIEKRDRKVMFEYILLDRINDSVAQAEELARLMKKPLYLVNLIPYNETGEFRASSKERIKKFREILEKKGVVVTERFRLGRDIEAACGQLAAKGKK